MKLVRILQTGEVVEDTVHIDVLIIAKDGTTIAVRDPKLYDSIDELRRESRKAVRK